MIELISPKNIDIQIKIVAKQISGEHRNDRTPVVMVGLLNGCFAFYSDLVRAYIVDDIYDTGNTMAAVIEYLEVKHPKSISIVSLVTRKTSPKPKVPFFNAFEIGDEWLVGFGMDNDKGYCRNLPAIYSL